MQSQKGFTLLEILISLFLLSVMLLGLDAIQITSLNETIASYYYTQAQNQLEEITEYLTSIKEADNSDVIAQWNKQNHEVLPQGHGEVQGSYPHYLISIFWGGQLQACPKNKIGKTGCITQTL